ncbi:MAG: aspartate carbamoyltransferase [Candidatus Njordarchaeales archaeon]
MSFYMRDVVSIIDFSRDDLEKLFRMTDKMMPYKRGGIEVLKGKIMASLFLEPSTRTRLSFESAMKRLGGDVITVSGAEGTSLMKGESFIDTIRMLDNYADIIVVRHKYEGAARLAADIAEVPIINAGDGRRQHPTQTMIDLYTVYKLKGRIDDLTYGLVGDLKYARTAASFIMGLSIFRPKKVYLISHELLRAREEILDFLKRSGIKYEEVTNLREVISELDILYVTRIQKERFPDPLEYEKVKGSYKITLDILKDAKDDLKILHPLPKVDEIDPKVDETKYAAYFIQASYGVPLRMALLALIFGAEVEK